MRRPYTQTGQIKEALDRHFYDIHPIFSLSRFVARYWPSNALRDTLADPKGGK